MKICIIGGSGFIGTRLFEALLPHHQLTIFDKINSILFPNSTVLIDIRDGEKLIQNLKDFHLIIHLAAEHHDDVCPVQLYYDVNVQGTRNILDAMTVNGIHHIIFTSSVAVYGLNKHNPSESFSTDPFNHYGKSKRMAEVIIEEWVKVNKKRSAAILRPTVIFGERNRGNVYNLLRQIASNRFIQIGKGNNLKSMAYVGNVVAFISHCIDTIKLGTEVYNYVDKPDLSMNELIKAVEKSLDRKVPSIRIPYWVGLTAGYGFDLLAFVIRRNLFLSSVRVRKFCATTQFDSSKVAGSGFVAPFSLSRGLDQTIQFEFIDKRMDDINFRTE